MSVTAAITGYQTLDLTIQAQVGPYNLGLL